MSDHASKNLLSCCIYFRSRKLMYWSKVFNSRFCVQTSNDWLYYWSIKVGFHYPSSRAELTARELGCIFWHPSTRVVETGRPCIVILCSLCRLSNVACRYIYTRGQIERNCPESNCNTLTSLAIFFCVTLRPSAHDLECTNLVHICTSVSQSLSWHVWRELRNWREASWRTNPKTKKVMTRD